MLVLLGGGIGSVFRYLVSQGAQKILGGGFAWGTLIVNLAGCFLIGLIVGLADRALVGRSLRFLLATGFLGGFTTFSTFSLESAHMLMAGQIAKGIVNLAVSVAGGLILAAAGLAAASRL